MYLMVMSFLPDQEILERAIYRLLSFAPHM
jgi:hypothetical protein